jgi:hypothetical protein
MHKRFGCWFLGALLLAVGCASEPSDLAACAKFFFSGWRPVAEERSERFLGKVTHETARCRGGNKPAALGDAPWTDWQNYWATGGAASRATEFPFNLRHLDPNWRGIDGALLDLEYQRIELIKFNLFDNSGTHVHYVRGRNGVPGPALKVWDEMRLPPEHAHYGSVGGNGKQLCSGELIRFRELTGICNDLFNPLMGSTGQPFARNVQFEATFPELGKSALTRNRHGDRIGLLRPDPQVISRKLFSRPQSEPDKCREGEGLPNRSVDASCDYQKAPGFNVLAAFWIQFMTHDWFSHLDEGRNSDEIMMTGCTSERRANLEQRLTLKEVRRLGCRPGDRIDTAKFAEVSEPLVFQHKRQSYLSRAYRTTRNTVTAWWDASQIYGYNEVSRRRIKRDPKDPAKLYMGRTGRHSGGGEGQGYLPLFESRDPIQPHWTGQEATAFPDNWTIGLSFYHNVFAREHNLFVDAFRRQAEETPEADSGLRHPARPDAIIRYKEVTADELFEIARLVIAAEIAKIHTTEWTPQLLYNEPLNLGMNANWHGFFRNYPLAEGALEKAISRLVKSPDDKKTGQWYSVFASGPGIFGLGSRVYRDDAILARYDPKKTDVWSLKNPAHVNGGTNHFGSPFNFPEEFTTVYRLHPLLPDLIDYRVYTDPNAIRAKIAVVDTFRAKATEAMRAHGLANWAVSLGRQRLGLLTLQNHPQFLQNLDLPRLRTQTGKIDVAALDIIRDRERGVPRFNEFRRQYGLKQLTSFDEFIDRRLKKGSPERNEQERLVRLLREVYGQHQCDAAKIITVAQLNDDGTPINDCLGYPNASMVDNIEDLDTLVGWLAEFHRPHGFAISETQFQVFILNASRRLFSDRFFTSSFRPEFYTHLGVRWVNDNGPSGRMMEKQKSNGHEMEVSPLKRVLLRTIPELEPELKHVVNVFDPWARDRGGYYSLAWKPRKGAESDPEFKNAAR